MAEPLDPPCADCGKTVQTLWSTAWDAYICLFCRAKRTDRELNPPVTAA
jgi:hypothetical protein